MKGAGDSPPDITIPGAKGQRLESLFSRWSDLRMEHMSFGEWKPLVSPPSFCSSRSELSWTPLAPNSPL